MTATGPVLVILAYHRVGRVRPGTWDTWFRIATKRFEEQLDAVAGAGWSIIEADAFEAALSDPARLPSRSVALTFDDAYRSFGAEALHVLQRRRLGAVMFVPAGLVGGVNEWDRDHTGLEHLATERDLRRWAGRGVGIGVHGSRHIGLSHASDLEVHEELVVSKGSLESVLARPVTLFSYPYGDAGPTTVIEPHLRSAGYRAAFLYGGGAVRLPTANPYSIDRVAVGPDTDIEQVLLKAAR